MSQGMIGADLASLRELAKTASLTGQDLAATATSLQNAVTRTRWSGFDADSFRSRWASSIRPTLNTASASLDSMSTQLFAQADAQETASAATGGSPTGSGGSGGGGTGSGGSGDGSVTSGGGAGSGTPGDGTAEDGNGWADAFTDPNYQHAPGGLEWGFETIFGGEGGQFQGVTNALKFVADKFAFNIGLANADDLAAMMPKFAGAMDGLGRGLAGAGIVLGGLDIASGIANEDPFRVADGTISAGLSAATLVLAATGVGAPAAAILGGVSLVWGLASMISGDVPLTKRVWDAGAAVVGGVQDAGAAVADGFQDAVGWLGGKLGFG